MTYQCHCLLRLGACGTFLLTKSSNQGFFIILLALRTALLALILAVAALVESENDVMMSVFLQIFFVVADFNLNSKHIEYPCLLELSYKAHGSTIVTISL